MDTSTSSALSPSSLRAMDDVRVREVVEVLDDGGADPSAAGS